MMDNTTSDDLVLSLDAFVRSISVNRGASHMFLLGAGASINSGVPSANTCIWQWKRDIFLSNNVDLGDQFGDISLPSVREKIQQWLDSEARYPSLGSPEEYGFYVERCYPIAQDRRQYFQSLAEHAKPYVGYQLLTLFAEAELVKSVWTTNFDGLVAKAALASPIVTIEVGLDTAFRSSRQARHGELLCVALHGDYRYDALKNTPRELQRQDEELRASLMRHIGQDNLIVVGYSGRDRSVMDTLTEAYSQPGIGRLYWCGYEDPEPDDIVRRLLDTARACDRQAYYIPTTGFDDLMIRLSLRCLSSALATRARAIYGQVVTAMQAQSPPFTIEPGGIVGVIKSNAFPLDCPSEVLQFDMRGLDAPKPWKVVRQHVEGTKVVAVPYKRKVLALGTVDDVKAAFAGDITSAIERSPIAEKELSIIDGAVVSLLTQAIVRSLAMSRDLDTDGRDLLWESTPMTTTRVHGTSCRVHNAVVLALRQYGGKQYLILKPTVRGIGNDGLVLPIALQQEIKRMFLTGQYNSQFNDAINAWRAKLFPQTHTRLEFPPSCGSTFKFSVRAAPALTKVSSAQARTSVPLTPQLQQVLVYAGVQYQEPTLLFSNQQGTGIAKDVHPIRGIVSNQPYDYSLTRNGLDTHIRIGVVCPAQDAAKVTAYLNGLHQSKQPDSKLEYLLPYPGFASAFGLPLEVPHTQAAAWIDCAEPDSSLDVVRGAAELGHRITASIKALIASAAPNVILIYIPERWQQWERYDTGDHRYDLHDFVKAYCVEKGVATQFIRQATLTKPHQCEVAWWLALSLYAKAMRTPWILESLDAETAYMGLGYSVTSTGRSGNHIVLGCSHIYNSQGLGLRYKLSKIENAILRKDNPYMSRDDARRMGENVRQLFFESMARLPKRVVIHKRTPFFPEEREGLLEGLSGIEAVDMLEINIDPMLRYVASRTTREGRLAGDAFPVRRGTTVALDRRRALVWVHGTADAVTPGRRYYLGKSRIPAPLLVTRHHGASNLGTLAREILGLSKMDWNSFDMYTRIPATIQSSNQIARIGALLERFGPLSYDYRLFI